MADRLEVDLCVIGGGSGGLSVAAGASQMGASVVLLEHGRMGGDCLNYGCVPSKALLAAAGAAEALRRAPAFGVTPGQAEVDFQRANDHVRSVIAAIAPQDSAERFQGLGVHVLRETGRFTGRRELCAGDTVIKARRFVIATGSAPLIPPIPGLDAVRYLTNETIFDNRTRPEHLIVVGGGPIGLELAQAHRRLGARVSVIEMATVLPKDDPEAAAVVAARLRKEGVMLLERSTVVQVSRTPSGVAVAIEREAGGSRTIEGSHLLLAVGRQANVGGLGLDKAGVACTPRGIQVDDRLRTTNKKIYAIGDVAGGLQFTHLANYHAGIVIRNALFRLPVRADHGAIPWVTYTDPELAHVGKTEGQARGDDGAIRVLRWAYAENDRARAERRTDGFVKVVTTRRGRILGATIVGAHAGELLQPWVLAMRSGVKLGKLASMVAPYPTLGEINKRVACSFYAPALLGNRTRKLVRFLSLFG